MMKISVMIVDDHPIYRQGVGELLTAMPNISVVGEANDGEMAVEIYQQQRPKIVIMDVNLPLKNGLMATREIKAIDPQTKVAIITAYDDDAQMKNAIILGADAYCSKVIAPTELERVIGLLVDGKHFFSGKVLTSEEKEKWRDRIADEHSHFGGQTSLSTREYEILLLVTRGLSNKQIALELGISHQTVKNHMTAILRKMGLEDRTQAAVMAISRGWIRQPVLSRPFSVTFY